MQPLRPGENQRVLARQIKAVMIVAISQRRRYRQPSLCQMKAQRGAEGFDDGDLPSGVAWEDIDLVVQTAECPYKGKVKIV